MNKQRNKIIQQGQDTCTYYCGTKLCKKPCAQIMTQTYVAHVTHGHPKEQ